MLKKIRQSGEVHIGILVVFVVAITVLSQTLLPTIVSVSQGISLNNALAKLNADNYVAWAVSGLSNTQVPYATGDNTLASESDFTYNPTTNTLDVDAITSGAGTFSSMN